MSTIDWAALKKTADDATKPAPEGSYELIVTKATAKNASTGSPMIVVQFRVVGGPSDGKTIFHNFVLTVDNAFALAMFFRGMTALGLSEAWFAQNDPSMEQIAATLIDRRVHAEIGVRAWQGQDRNEIKSFSPPQGGLNTPPSSSIGVPVVNATGMSSGGVPNIPTPTAQPLTTPTSVGSIPTPSNLPI